MSKGLRNIKDPIERYNTVERRLRGEGRGLGYLAAKDAMVGLKPKEEGSTPPQSRHQHYVQ